MKTLIVNLDTFALNATAILLDNDNLDASTNITVPYHSFSSIADVVDSQGVKRVILKGSPVFLNHYKDGLQEALMCKHSSKNIEIIID